MSVIVSFSLTLLTALQAPLIVTPEKSAWQRVREAYAVCQESALAGADFPAPMLVFSAEELREALPEAIAAARAEADEAVAEAQALEYARICLEYYPLAARTNEDFRELSAHLEESKLDTSYRLYLLEHLVPRPETPPSLFGQYMQEGALDEYMLLRSRLGRLAVAGAESQALRVAAMEALFELQVARLRRVLALEPSLSQGGALPEVTLLQQKPRLSPRTQRAVAQGQEEFVNAAKLYARLLNPASPEDPVHQKALELLHRTLDTIHLPNPEVVRALLPPA